MTSDVICMDDALNPLVATMLDGAVRGEIGASAEIQAAFVSRQD